MYITATEEDRLAIFAAAAGAPDPRRRPQAQCPRGDRLICDEMHRAARAGASRAEVLAAGRAAVDAAELIDGVAALMPEIRLEVLMYDGTRLVLLRDMWAPGPGADDSGGRPARCAARTATSRWPPASRDCSLAVASRSARPIRVSSHYPFWRVNSRLDFDRAAAARLPAGHPGRAVGPVGSWREPPGRTWSEYGGRWRHVMTAPRGTDQADYSAGSGRPPATGSGSATPTSGYASRTTTSATATSRCGATRKQHPLHG